MDIETGVVHTAVVVIEMDIIVDEGIYIRQRYKNSRMGSSGAIR